MAYGELKVDSITFTNGGTDTTVSVSGLVQNPTFSGDITVTGTISGDVVRGGTLVSGATVTGNAAQFTTLTGGAAGFTTVTGTTVTGTTANFATLSGTTVTGGTGQFTSLTSTTATITSGVFASGTAAAPSVSVGTTSNGLYSPGTDQVALSTNGTGRLFVDASGNVGVGVSSGGPSSNDLLLISNKAIRWQHSTNGTQYGDIYTDASSNIVFRNGGSSTERLRITSAGLVGIGTSSPGFKLTIEDSTTPRIRIGDGTRHLNVDGGSASQNAAIGTDYAGSFGIYTNGAANTRFHITSAGLVGIGTTSPDTKLHVSGSGTQRIKITGTGSANAILTLDAPSSFGSYIEYGGSASNPLIFYDVNASAERARIDTSGRLLVGTSTSFDSASLIQLSKSSGTNAVNVKSASLANGESSYFGATGGTRAMNIGVNKHSAITNPCAYIYMQAEDGAQNFLWVDNSDVLRISTTSAHIGTTSGTVVGTQTSDERIKNVLGPVEYGLNTLKQIEPVRYSPKSEPDTEKLGFIAQQIQPLVPQSVFDTGERIEGEPEDAPTKLGMEYVALIPVLVNAIKELSVEIDALKAQLQAP